jgi:L-seryl-tRNA(Ser) seleniumtransferase
MATETRTRPPSVEAVLAIVRRELDGAVDPAVLTAAARSVVDDERERLGAGEEPRTVDDLAARVADRLATLRSIRLETVINATGVIVHTNLGRAPWPRAAIEAAAEAAGAYLFLELDRGTGRRGARFRQAEEHLIALTGAEDALVTNNNAAAVGLAVGLVGRGRGVAVSRGELVEIGGGVRIPEIVRRAGARLVEVGTTNRTRVADFEEVLASGRVKAVLRVHPRTSARRASRKRPMRPRSRTWPIATARSSSTIWARVPCCRRSAMA